MQGFRRSWWLLIPLLIFTLVLSVQAQEVGPTLTITNSDASTPPNVELTLYGIDGSGNPLDLANQPLTVSVGETAVSNVTVSGSREVGTFTLFLIDNTPGVIAQEPAIQEAILQFASSPTMKEQIDTVTIYQVGATEARELLPPTSFYNAIINFFAQPLPPEVGATALDDSLGDLIEKIDTLRPAGTFASIVVLTDGTDSVSSRFGRNDIAPLAAQAGIPIHTIPLANVNLSPDNQALGRTHLQGVAAGSRGLFATLDDPASLDRLWQQIARFRDQAVASFSVSGLPGGTVPVSVSLTNAPEAADNVQVTFAGNTPVLLLDIPTESRTLTLPSLDGVQLQLSGSVSWLDGVERTLQVAQLQVNGEVVQDIPIETLGDFTAVIDNFQYGVNNVQIVALDEQELQARSPIIELTISEGARDVPEALDAGGGGGILRTFIFFIIAVALFGGGLFLAWRQGLLNNLSLALPRGRRQPRESNVVIYNEDGSVASGDQPGTQAAYLEVLDATSRMPQEIPLQGRQVRIGRSPAQSDIAFENDITMSRLHAVMLLEGGHYRLYDQQSTSGTFVNDQPVQEYGTQLRDGDEIHFGAVLCRYRQAS